MGFFRKYNPFARLRRNRLRQIMRGHRALRKTDRLALLATTKGQLSTMPMERHVDSAAAYIYHDALPQADGVIRQYLMQRIGGMSLNRSVLAAFGGAPIAIHIAPKEMRKLLEAAGVPVAHSWSQLIWIFYVFAIWGYGVLQIAKTFYTHRPRRHGISDLPTGSVFFAELSPNNLPASNISERRYDLLSWYAQWKGRPPSHRHLFHDVPDNREIKLDGVDIRRQENMIPPLTNWRNSAKYLGWGGTAAARALFDCARGNWQHALLLSEAARAHLVSLHQPKELNSAYWFHHTRYLYRPLWTYVAEAKGAELALYFYSVNNSAIQKAGSNPPAIGLWQLMTWPKYIVWDERQRDFIKGAVGPKAQITSVGDLPFTDSAADMPQVAGASIAVFDIQPFRAWLHVLQAQVYEYYNAKTCTQFLHDIHFTAQTADAKMLWKRKREISRLAHPAYSAAAQALAQQTQHIICVDPAISAHRVIEAADIVISMPFTSTALIARNYGKPSCYYDASGVLDPNDHGAHGIPVIQGREELMQWVQTAL